MHPYLQFLQFCLHPDSPVPACVKHINWHKLRKFAKQQAIGGVYWMGFERLKDLQENKPTDDDVLEWMALITKIRKQNATVEEKARWVSNNFQKEGFRCCLLKGQGNARMYPDPTLRVSGDIDMWVEGGDDKVIAYINKIAPGRKACYHHIDFRRAGNVDVEVHYRPSWLNNPIYNQRLQQWFSDHSDACFSHTDKKAGYQTPTNEFNYIFQLCHIYNHLLHEGIGLRQIIDYFYLLKYSDSRKVDITPTLTHLGLMPIAGAVMWVLINMLGLEETYLICPADKKRGQILMNEIIKGGNFGHHDQRFLSGSYSSPLKKNLQRLVRDIRLCRFFPSESLCEPWFRLYHFMWRLKHSRR